MRFIGTGFSCDIAVFRHENDLVVKFYDQAKEHPPEQLRDLVIADPGYGYLSLKSVGSGALLTGFLDEAVFSDALAEEAIELVERLAPAAGYVPHHVRRFRSTGFVEYNGEY